MQKAAGTRVAAGGALLDGRTDGDAAYVATAAHKESSLSHCDSHSEGPEILAPNTPRLAGVRDTGSSPQPLSPAVMMQGVGVVPLPIIPLPGIPLPGMPLPAFPDGTTCSTQSRRTSARVVADDPGTDGANPKFRQGPAAACDASASLRGSTEEDQQEPSPQVRSVLSEMEGAKARFRSIDAGMTALMERAIGTGSYANRYTSAQESISKTLRRRGPSLHLTKQPVLRMPLYPRSHAVMAASYHGITASSTQLAGAALVGGSLESHVALQQQSMAQEFEHSYAEHTWKPARRSTVMRRVDAVALVLPAWRDANSSSQQETEEAPFETRPRKRTAVWERLTRNTSLRSGAPNPEAVAAAIAAAGGAASGAIPRAGGGGELVQARSHQGSRSVEAMARASAVPRPPSSSSSMTAAAPPAGSLSRPPPLPPPRTPDRKQRAAGSSDSGLGRLWGADSRAQQLSRGGEGQAAGTSGRPPLGCAPASPQRQQRQVGKKQSVVPSTGGGRSDAGAAVDAATHWSAGSAVAPSRSSLQSRGGEHGSTAAAARGWTVAARVSGIYGGGGSGTVAHTVTLGLGLGSDPERRQAAAEPASSLLRHTVPPCAAGGEDTGGGLRGDGATVRPDDEAAGPHSDGSLGDICDAGDGGGDDREWESMMQSASAGTWLASIRGMMADIQATNDRVSPYLKAYVTARVSRATGGGAAGAAAHAGGSILAQPRRSAARRKSSMFRVARVSALHASAGGISSAWMPSRAATPEVTLVAAANSSGAGSLEKPPPGKPATEDGGGCSVRGGGGRPSTAPGGGTEERGDGVVANSGGNGVGTGHLRPARKSLIATTRGPAVALEELVLELQPLHHQCLLARIAAQQQQ